MYFSAFMIFGLLGAALMIAGDAYRLRRFCWAAPVMVLFLLGTQPAFRLLPTVSYDRVLLNFDYRLGYDFAIGRAFSGPAPLLLVHMFYAGLPLAVAFVYSLLDPPSRWRFGLAMLLVSVVALPVYAICPAAGPIYVFGQAFPFHPPVADPLPFAGPGLTMNAIPSAHVAWALLLWWHSRKCLLGVRIAAGVFLVGTALATLATGEHYLVDLVAAVPFAVAIDGAALRRWVGAAFCGAVVLLWSLALRVGLLNGVSHPLAVSLAVATVAIPLLLHRLAVGPRASAVAAG